MVRSRIWLPAALLAGAVLSTSASTSSTGKLLVACKGEHALGIVDPAAGKQIALVPEDGVTGHEVIASPDGRTAYVPIYGNSGVGKPGTDGKNVVAIDLASQKIVGNLVFDHGVRPHCPMIGPKDGMLYVSTELDKTITIIDPHTMKVTGTVPTGQPESHMFVLAHDGRRAYTANVGPGTVSVIDLEAKKTLSVIPISRNTQRIAITPDDGLVFTADQTLPRLAVIDTKTDKIAHWVTLPGEGYGTAPTADGRYLVVAVPTVNKVSVVDLKTFEVVHNIDVPAAPQEVLVAPNGIAYVSCNHDHKIAAISTSDWSVKQLIDAGKDSDGLAWAAGS